MGYFIVLKYVGDNLENLLNAAKKAKINVYKIKKISEKEYLFHIKKRDETIFFANRALVCYNIKKERSVGFLAEVSSFFKNAGLIIGSLVFIAVSCAFSGCVLSLDFTGSGAVYSEKTLFYLEKNNVKKFSFPSAEDIKNAEKEIYESLNDFSFVSVSKRGTKITVNLIKYEEIEVINAGKERIISPASGVIESIKLIGGTALFNVGDAVSEGDVLVDGYKMIGEKKVESKALAVITLIANAEYVCDLIAESEENAYLLFLGEHPNFDVVEKIVEKISLSDDWKNRFSIKIKYRLEVK